MFDERHLEVFVEVRKLMRKGRRKEFNRIKASSLPVLVPEKRCRQSALALKSRRNTEGYRSLPRPGRATQPDESVLRLPQMIEERCLYLGLRAFNAFRLCSDINMLGRGSLESRKFG